MGVVWEERGAKEDGDVVVTGVVAVGGEEESSRSRFEELRGDVNGTS